MIKHAFVNKYLYLVEYEIDDLDFVRTLTLYFTPGNKIKLEFIEEKEKAEQFYKTSLEVIKNNRQENEYISIEC